MRLSKSHLSLVLSTDDEHSCIKPVWEAFPWLSPCLKVIGQLELASVKSVTHV